MKKEPETYEELIRQKRCVDLTRHYNLTEEQLEQVYEFLKNNPKGKITGDKTKISLSVGFKVVSVINALDMLDREIVRRKVCYIKKLD